uniref:Uncharacterized protein n=1 Tax=Chromera velia CCMP2878 TaxID=1169474 RepID=A0A0G4H062_9ALVE|eukprot:Cvel_5490.t1-p1 / transcript=Cvel_5490.t1 / gene=Cvel_5490 / organism=Chromera_velia_CCMP2878 / gene_product=hypothetical protein / transcript_product=hypothetical protein / location=Cvel_scaffold257:6234-6518(-) / protein_length=95 / sequence_SO=supercontig / SO=protein_coding / is_pseudo=false
MSLKNDISRNRSQISLFSSGHIVKPQVAKGELLGGAPCELTCQLHMKFTVDTGQQGGRFHVDMKESERGEAETWVTFIATRWPAAPILKVGGVIG